MRVLVIDGQGGGVGKVLCERLKAELPEVPVVALGTNAMATAAMLRAGADQGATGENAICVNAQNADLILGPIGVVVANAMMGELTPRMAEAVGASRAKKILVPIGKCRVQVAGAADLQLSAAIEDAIALAKSALKE